MLYWLMGLGVLALCALLAVTHLHDRAETKALESSHQEADDLRRVCDDDVALLGADVRRHAPLDDLGELTDEAWRTARDLHAHAGDLLRQASAPHQFEQVSALLAEARQSLAEVQALVLDDEAPEARPCCFFNPNHGPADTTTAWRTETGEVALPCCHADARRVASGADPYARTWPVGDDRVVWWLAGEAVQPWARGWFGAWRGTPQWTAMSRVAPVLEPSLETDAA